MKQSLGEIVANTKAPLTVQSLVVELRALGVKPGMTLLCHCSLSSLGWVNGGAQAVVEALQAALGPRGTVVMPTHSPDLSNPALWSNPPVPDEWWQEICATMPAWNRQLTPSNGMGIVAETFRKAGGVRRSDHPHFSFAASGPHARRICTKHQLDFGLGEGSPLARLYELDAHILMLGAGWESCTAFHLAEYRCEWVWKAEQADFAPLRRRRFPWSANALSNPHESRVWQRIRNWNTSADDFGHCGNDFEASTPTQGSVALRTGTVGNASCRLVNLRSAVNFAQAWIPGSRIYYNHE